MNSYILILILICPFLAYGDEIDCENAMTTNAMNICVGRENDRADENLDKYLTKAKEKYSSETRVIESLSKSQVTWLEYRKTYCDAIYEMWSGGTIRGVMYGACMLKLTHQRTHDIWADYLTYMDSTPPMLPEPK